MEAQLASLDRGNDDPARADQIRRTEDAVNRQQFEVDRLVAQGRRSVIRDADHNTAPQRSPPNKAASSTGCSALLAPPRP